MSILVADCPRCGASSMTFDVSAQVYVGQKYDWQSHYELFSKCRACSRPSIFLVSLKEIQHRDIFRKPDALVSYQYALNQAFDVKRFIGLRDLISHKAPEHLPPKIKESFDEGAACFSIGCYNAAATMFRLCVDLVTTPFLPDPSDNTTKQPNEKQRRDLGLRLQWLFDNNCIPQSLRELAGCIKDDGNDGAHKGIITKEDAEDVLDFTFTLLERLVTEAKRIELAQERKNLRRSKRP